MEDTPPGCYSSMVQEDIDLEATQAFRPGRCNNFAMVSASLSE